MTTDPPASWWTLESDWRTDPDITWDDLFHDDGDLRPTQHEHGDPCPVCDARRALWMSWFSGEDDLPEPTRDNAADLYPGALPDVLR